jgi:hypothetical protein
MCWTLLVNVDLNFYAILDIFWLSFCILICSCCWTMRWIATSSYFTLDYWQPSLIPVYNNLLRINRMRSIFHGRAHKYCSAPMLSSIEISILLNVPLYNFDWIPFDYFSRFFEPIFCDRLQVIKFGSMKSVLKPLQIFKIAV